HLLVDLHPDTAGYAPRQFTPFGNRFAFVFGGELWLTDGTAAGTVRVRGNVNINVESMAAAGRQLFLLVRNGGNPQQPWVSDGTDAGTRVIPIGTGKDPFPPYVSQDLTALGDRV